MKGEEKHYTEIASDLRVAILAGRCAPGTRLLAERELGEQWGVSRVTIRRALRVLEDERLVQRRHGSGTYVSPKPSRRVPLMIDYTGTMREHAPALKRRVLCRRWQPAGHEAAETLGIGPEDQVLYVERIDELEGAAVARDYGHLVARFAAKLTERDLSRVDFVETWTRRERFSIAACRQTIEAVAAPREIAQTLGLSRGRPVLKSTECYLAANERPAALFVSLYHPAHICIASTYRWGDVVTRVRRKRRPLS